MVNIYIQFSGCFSSKLSACNIKRNGEKHHRADVIYLCDYICDSDMKYHPDKNQVGYEWQGDSGLSWK